jgi:hypothetical protein
MIYDIIRFPRFNKNLAQINKNQYFIIIETIKEEIKKLEVIFHGRKKIAKVALYRRLNQRLVHRAEQITREGGQAQANQ